jgi:tetratricopeptide (TPR) repeat protein
MAPEAHYGGPIDQRTDIFSLGAVFYEMLTARHPFAAETPERVLHRIMHDAPQPAASWNAAVTPALSSVVERMLARDPSQRFDSCADVRAALMSARRASGTALTAEETRPLERRRTPGSPATWRWAAALAALAIAIAVWRAVAAPRLPAERRLAVLIPGSPGATDDFAAWALGATDLLATRLARHQDQPGFQTLTFGESWDEHLASAGDARKAYGANLALRTTLEQRGNQLHGRLELFEPRRERVLAERVVDVLVDEPYVFADSLYHGALSLLRLPGRPSPPGAGLGIRGAGTFRFLLQGLGRRRSASDDAGRTRAMGDLETACRMEPDAAVPRVWLAWAQLAQYAATQDSTWLARAEASAREAVALDSTRADAHRVLASALVQRKRYAEAVESYRVSVALDPTDDDAWYRWGRTRQRLGDVEGEREVYEAAIARRPHSFKPRWWLATWAYRNGHLDDALQDYREMIRRSPDYFNGYASLGGLLLPRGEYAAAIDTLHIAVALNPSSSAYGNLGTAYFTSGRLAQAVDAYNQAFQFGDADHVTWLNLGDAYFWLRDRPDQARDAYRQAVRLGRQAMLSREQGGHAPDPMIPAMLATVYPKLGERDSARIMLAQALAIDSTNSRVQYEAALTLWQLGDHDAAISRLRRAVEGGYPVLWLRDSPVHREWRDEPGFQAVVASAAPAANRRSPVKGEGR